MIACVLCDVNLPTAPFQILKCNIKANTKIDCIDCDCWLSMEDSVDFFYFNLSFSIHPHNNEDCLCEYSK